MYLLYLKSFIIFHMSDSRNVTDEFKNIPHEEIVMTLDERGVELEIAIENLERDFNMGTIVRSANAFGIRRVHVIGRKQWNKRGAMATDKYLHVEYHSSVVEFMQKMHQDKRKVIAVDNVDGATDLSKATLPKRCVLVFGAEGSGLSEEMLHSAEVTVAIEQLGSTRSINVGVAAGIVMYEWLKRNSLT